MKAAWAEERGRRQQAAASVLAVLAARGLSVPDRVREVIEASTDLEQLDRWHTRAITASSVDEVIEEP